jgi:DNA polymerase III subunit delta'
VNPANLPPWIRRQTQQLLAKKGHAWLLQGPSGLGQYSLGLALISAWLCENPMNEGACGTCPSCHAIAVRTHADLFVLMPETTLQALDWPLSEKAQSDLDEKKRKPSREIRVEAMRDALQFSQRTSARGRGKAVLVFPAERMNHITANTLLKTLEEPAGDLRFVLASQAAHELLPTLRSRCQLYTMAWPEESEALPWLQSQGVAAGEAPALLKSAGGRPEDALTLAQSGMTAQLWMALPKAIAQGDVSVFKDWGLKEVLGTLHKLCHDLMLQVSGAEPVFFGAADLPKTRSLKSLSDWSRQLVQSSRTVEHPFNAGLMLEDLLSQAHMAIHGKDSRSNANANMAKT